MPSQIYLAKKYIEGFFYWEGQKMGHERKHCNVVNKIIYKTPYVYFLNPTFTLTMKQN